MAERKPRRMPTSSGTVSIRMYLTATINVVMMDLVWVIAIVGPAGPFYKPKIRQVTPSTSNMAVMTP